MKYEVITFDCYGTLIDWESGISAAFIRLAEGHGWTVTREAILAAYSQVEPVVEAEEYRSYRETLAETSRRVARTFGWTIPESEIDFLADSLWTWRPFKDTSPALLRLRESGHRLGILSNVDDDLLEKTLRHLSVPFDFVVTAQQVRSYKPELGHFIAAKERIGQSSWLHAAQSYFHDIVPCYAMGIPSAWVNRTGEVATQEATAEFEVRDLADLAERLGAK